MFRFGDPGGRIYGSGNILKLWSSANNGIGNWAVTSSGGRTTGSCLTQSGSGSNRGLVSPVLDTQATWGVAKACQFSGYPSGEIWAWIDTIGGSTQIDLRVSGGLLQVTRNGTQLGISAAAIPLNAWFHLEFKGLIHPSAGTYDVRVNGVSVLSGTGANTRATSNSWANQFRMSENGVNGPTTAKYDDVIVYDGQTTDANAFADIVGPIGDCGLAWLLPSGAGTTTQFTPSTGANYAAVDDATPNDDTDYVEDSTVGHIDTYAMGDLPAGASGVVALATILYARKTDVGSRGVQSELRSAGGNTAHATEIALGNSYQYWFQNWGRDPNNGSATAWTVAAVNALEMGDKVSS